jgi:thiamine biosynthesis lipoprotein ApbE
MDAVHRFELWGTTASVVVTDPRALGSVVEIVRAGLDDVERACSRFRPDSELCRLTPGTSRLSPLLADLVGTALDAAEASGGLVLHHIVDPRTAAPAAPVWRSTTVAAVTCAEANTASTAAVVLGVKAPRWLADRGYLARLVDQRHRVVHVGDWPPEAVAA